MTKPEETCEYGKKYPCCNCPEPCAEELKRREFYRPDDEEELDDEDNYDGDGDDEEDWY